MTSTSEDQDLEPKNEMGKNKLKSMPRGIIK